MGQFSWLDCKTGEQVVDNKRRKVYLLIPKEFGGGHIEENCYDGYGHFGGKDVYDLVADWNREYISEHPFHIFPSRIRDAQWNLDCVKNGRHGGWRNELQAMDKKWFEPYSDLSKTREQVLKVCRGEWRYIGIDIACYDEDNEALPYPIKITHDANAVYEDCEPSGRDPNQGWEG